LNGFDISCGGTRFIMVKKESKGRIRRLRQRVQQRITSNFQGRAGFFKSSAVQGVLRFVPTPVRRMLPFVAQEFQPELDAAKGIIHRKRGERGEQELEDIEQGIESTIPLFDTSRSLYSTYACSQGNPLSCKWSQQTTNEDSEKQYCFKCGFPAILANGKKIRGSRDVYQIEFFISDRGKGRFYKAVQLPDRQPVILKEYLLPKKYFSSYEIRARKESFEQLAGLDLSDGRQIQDFRFLSPTEAISDAHQERCYLIFKGDLYGVPTLASYLYKTGAFSNIEVLQVLDQVLQSLHFLHIQKFRLSGRLVEFGIIHGNLNLHSLLIVPNFQGFFIYLTDLALWEEKFNLPLHPPANHSQIEDLKALGYVGFYLLAGGQFNPTNGKPLEPEIDSDWPDTVSLELKEYLLNLMGKGVSNYETAEIARRHLSRLPILQQAQQAVNTEVLLAEKEKKRKKRSRRLLFSLLAVLGLLVLAAILAVAFRREQPIAVVPEITQENINDVVGIPTGTFTYLAEPNGTWNYIITQPYLLQDGKKLKEIIRLKQPELQLNAEFQSEVLNALTSGSMASFAITTLVNDTESDPTLARSIFAYDGLVVFVPFSYSERMNSLPQALQGKISFEQLRQLYTGKISNWQELGGPNLPVKLYVPAKEEALRLFEKRVLQDEEAIADFRRLVAQNSQSDSFLADRDRVAIAQVNSTQEMLRYIIQDFESSNEVVGSLGFDTFSEVFGQCSVYPLALSDGRSSSISPLIQNRGKPITPGTDLCNDKGSYAPNTNAFVRQEYPLAYPLAVVYPRDNRQEPVGEKFAEILRTVEVQKILQETGLIPLQSQQR
jgi:hypothetical protein